MIAPEDLLAQVRRVMEDDFNHRGDVSVRVVDVTVEGESIVLHLEGAHGYTETWDWPLHPPDEDMYADDMYAYGMTINLEEMYYSLVPFGQSPLVELEHQRAERGPAVPLDPVAREQLESYLAEEPTGGVDRGIVTDVGSVSQTATRRRERLESALGHLDGDRARVVKKLAAAQDRIILMSRHQPTPRDLRMKLYAGGTLRDLRAGRSILESWLVP